MTVPGGRSADLWGGVLVGGASRRMGEPKQLLRFRGVTLLERAVAALAPHVAGVALLGDGPVPEGAADLPRVPDIALARVGRGAEPTSAADARKSPPPAGAGPLAGMLAALRWKPDVAWIFAPCDLPLIDAAAVAWLIGERRPDRRAVVPRPEADGPVHALFALYEPAARRLLEDLAAGGGRAPRLVATDPRVAVVTPPADLAPCWRGVNTRAELEALGGETEAGAGERGGLLPNH
jgi:molybdenum cofactor guanylyltransferase